MRLYLIEGVARKLEMKVRKLRADVTKKWRI